MSFLKPQVYLIQGNQEETKTYALDYAKHLFGESHLKKIDQLIHPDLFIIAPEDKNHTIGPIQKLIAEANLPPFEAPFKVFIIEQAEKLTPISGNALLKILEEPFAKCKFLLLTRSVEEILPTLASRAVFVKLSSVELPSKEALIEYFIEILARFFLDPVTPPFLDSLDALEKKWEEGASIEPFIETFINWVRDLHIARITDLKYKKYTQEILEQSKKQIPSLEKGIDLAQTALLAFERGVKPKVIFEHLFHCCRA